MLTTDSKLFLCKDLACDAYLTYEEQLSETRDQEKKSVNINRQMNDTSKYLKAMVKGVIQHNRKGRRNWVGRERRSTGNRMEGAMESLGWGHLKRMKVDLVAVQRQQRGHLRK